MIEFLAILAVIGISLAYATMIVADYKEDALTHLLLNIIFAIAVAYLVGLN